jgi:decaprenylphospho-beta-D-erythro-pentofuranosid-2-ulose 2-reductase
VNTVLLGATRGLGRALARLLAARGDRLCLLGRDPHELERSARDLEVHGAPAPVQTFGCDLADPDGFGPALDAAVRALGSIELVVVTAGAFGTQDQLEADPKRCRRVLELDFTNTVLFCEQARVRLLARGGGTLCVFTSVAGERARKPVALYGAAKAGLSHYLDGLDLRHRDQGLRVVDVRPGFARTGMTEGLRAPPFAASPEQVADAALRGIERGRRIVHAPSIWRAVMWAVRALPRPVLRRAAF